MLDGLTFSFLETVKSIVCDTNLTFSLLFVLRVHVLRRKHSGMFRNKFYLEMTFLFLRYLNS